MESGQAHASWSMDKDSELIMLLAFLNTSKLAGDSFLNV